MSLWQQQPQQPTQHTEPQQGEYGISPSALQLQQAPLQDGSEFGGVEVGLFFTLEAQFH
jgi:hypothetical protein